MAIDQVIYTDIEMQPEVESLYPESSTVAAPPSDYEKTISPSLGDNTPPEDDEKNPSPPLTKISDNEIHPHFTAPRPTFRMLMRRLRRYISNHWRRIWARKKSEPRVSPRGTTLRRMAKTRRLVTSLNRLLASKSDVITQIQKRLLQGTQPGTQKASLGNGGSKGEELEVAIYMGDVQGTFLWLHFSDTWVYGESRSYSNHSTLLEPH